MTQGPARRAVVAVLGVLAVAAATAVGPATTAPADAATATATANVPTYTESPDYATETFGDPWDYSNTADQNTDRVGYGRYSISKGHLIGTLERSTYFSPVETMPGTLPYGRDGALHPIDTKRYTHLSVSMDQPYAGRQIAISWFTCAARSLSCMGGVTAKVEKGNHVVDVDLTGKSVMGGHVPWTGSKPTLLRVQPIVVHTGESPSGKVSIDWTRLHGGSAPQDALPAGDYGTFRVVARPIAVVDSPNPDQGKDLAAVQRGRSWVLTNGVAGRGVTLKNARFRSWSSVGLTAQNAGPIVRDPEVVFPVSAFDGKQYHWLSWSMSYDGAYDLRNAPGGGKMARLVWSVRGAKGLQVSNDVLTFSGANATPVGPNESGENRIDLAATNPLDETMPKGSPGWKQVVTSLRWDPNEDRGAAVWHLKSFHLRADPAANGWTRIGFHDAAWTAGTTAKVTVTRDGTTTKRVLVDGAAVTKGANSVPFVLGTLPAGSYHATVTLRHPDGSTATSTSAAPVRMSAAPVGAHDPRGHDQAPAATATGVTVAGWAYDPDTTRPLTIRVAEAGRVLATGTTGLTRNDVRKVHPDAPIGSGYRFAVPLASGSHTLCTTAVGAGSGMPETDLGCRTVRVP